MCRGRGWAQVDREERVCSPTSQPHTQAETLQRRETGVLAAVGGVGALPGELPRSEKWETS